VIVPENADLPALVQPVSAHPRGLNNELHQAALFLIISHAL